MNVDIGQMGRSIITNVVFNFRETIRCNKQKRYINRDFHYAHLVGQVDTLLTLRHPLADWASRLHEISLQIIIEEKGE